MSEVLIQDTSFEARDGYTLAATVFAPAQAPRGAVLINSATAVPRKIYRGFATYLAEQGHTVLTYDYRGIGGSRPRSLRGFAVRMRDWAALDVAAAIDHMRNVWPKLPLGVVGHSFGGQALGLAPNNDQVSRALFVAAQAGYWRLFHSPEKYRVYAMLRLIGAPIARTLGYVPGRFGIGEDLPRDVFLEWTGWVMRPRYFFDDATLDALANFPRYRGRLRAICLTDDPWATAPAVDLLCSGFTGTTPERIDIAPSDAGTAKLGHFGFFRPEHRDTLWRDAAAWLAPAQTGA
ncbi:MAG TPA: alpha/beta fold hydrolase [Xanthobacteraceae bacterium]|nr:alpha/beta fold hydrolase [Xanthobacteraceae bacterium]